VPDEATRGGATVTLAPGAALALVAVGSAFGGAARFFVSGIVARAFGETFPWGTLAVNVSGTLAIGLLWPFAEAGVLPAPGTWQLAAAGFLGSYTTVSSFSLQTLTLLQDGDLARAAANLGGSLALCLGAAGTGLALGRALLAGA
jgi:fluoride exporter